MKGSSFLQNVSNGMTSLWKECVNQFYSEAGRVRLSFYDLNKGTLVYSQAEGQDALRQAILSDYNNKSNEKQVKGNFQQPLRIGLLSATYLFQEIYPIIPVVFTTF